MKDDFQLVELAQNGNRLAFRDLVLKHQKFAYNLAYDLTGNHFDAEDLSQEVFITVYNALPNFRGDSKFSSWLYRITINTWINQRRVRNYKLRASQKSIQREDEEMITRPDDSANPERNAEEALMREHVQKALQKLSKKEKSVFVLRQFHDKKLSEIAELLDVKIGTVKTLLFRALKKMQKELEFYQNNPAGEDVR